MRWLREKIIKCVIDNIQIGGHCGLCGKWMPNQLFPKTWAWGVCDKCAGREE